MLEQIKKSLSFLLIFLFLFNISFQVPFGSIFWWAKAANVAYTDLVTIFVEMTVWRWGWEGVINRYAGDISRNLENTQVVIVPVPIDATPFKIASINEKFYFEGLWGERNLVGSVFIGDIPIPVVHDNDDFSRTIFPYVDFRDKWYVYNQISGKYEKNEKRIGAVEAEIWHWFISPNSSQYWKVESIINYFEKNHEFYQWVWKFDPENWLMNGSVDEEKTLHEEYVPEVFYFDQKRESDSLSYSSYKWYLASQVNYHEDEEWNIFRNKEDIAYNRFTKTFAEYLQTQVLWKDQENVEGLLEDVVELNADSVKWEQAWALIEALTAQDPVESNGLWNPNVWDIQARNVIWEIWNKFVEIFSPWMIGESRENVRNAWRYSNTGSTVNMDSIPSLVSHLDSITTTVIKSINTELEWEIDALVMTGWLSRNIAVPTKLAHLDKPGWWTNAIAGQVDVTCWNYKEFTNFLDGRKWNYINTAADCTAYYGNSDFWWQLVEANRWLNTSHVAKSWESTDGGSFIGSGNPTWDITEYLEFHSIPIDEWDSYKDAVAEMCATNEREFTYGYWWGNTPLNLDINAEEADLEKRMLSLREWTDLGSSITSVRDITGWQLVENTSAPDEVWEYPSLENDFFVNSENNNPSPLHCLDNNYILTQSIWNPTIKFDGWIEYDDPLAQTYEPNLYFWNDEEDVLLTEATEEFSVFDFFNTEWNLTLDDQWTWEDNSSNVCAVTYNLPMIKPMYEWVPHLGFEGALGTWAVYNLEPGVPFEVLPVTMGEYFTNPPVWRGFDYEPTTTSETQNWTCESRNIKFDLNFTFDYVYKKIAESLEAWDTDACVYTAMFLTGNSEVFSPLISDEEEQEEPVEIVEEWIEEIDKLEFLEVLTSKTLTWWYLEEGYFENLDTTWAKVVPQTLSDEDVLTELVKTNYGLTATDGDLWGWVWNGSWEQSDDNYASKLESCKQDIVNYFYKEIPSYIEHKSPEPYELYSQIKHKVTPNLPIDRDRYIDFIAANNSYQKILYPYLFRIDLSEGLADGQEFETQEGTLEEKLILVDQKIKEVLDEKSLEINEVIARSNPETLTDPIDIEIYEHLKVADFPEEEIDLYQILQDIEPTEMVSFLDIKEVTYYDLLVLSVYWNNLQSVPAKYKFVMEQYLSDQYQRPELKFLLPKNKKQYEIAYLWAPWSATEMYVSLDPEAKWDNPFADIIYDNVELGTQLFSSNVYEDVERWEYRCAPPEWVPLWEWPSALSCWLEGFNNPKISFSENSCSQKTLFLTPEEQEAFNQCGWDFDRNWVEDCVQYALPDAEIQLYSDSPSYFYNTTGKITVVVNNSEWNPIKYDNTSRVNLEVISIEPRNGETVDDEGDYIYYNFVDTKNSYWEANFYFTWRDKDVDVFVRATLELQDSNGEIFTSLVSEDLKIEIRGDRFFASTYVLSEEEEDLGFQIGENTIVASDATNIFVADELSSPVAWRETEVSWISDAPEKLVLSLSNYNNKWENIAVNYPVNIEIFQWIDEFQDDVDQVYKEYVITGPEGLLALSAISESGFYRFRLTDASGITNSRVIQVIPDEATRIELNLSTNISETGKVHTPHIFTLYDQYDNIADSDFYTVTANIRWNGVTFDDLTKSKTFTTYEWFQAFKLISEEWWWESLIEFSVDGVTTNELFYVVENLNLIVEPQFDELVVWWDEYKYTVQVEWAWADVDNLNTSLYVSANEVYLEPTESLFDIIDGRSEISIRTKKSSWIDIPIEFQAYGLRDVYREEQTILHEQAIKIDISLDKDKIEASPEWKARLTVELKDRFWNTAFTDNSSTIELLLQDKVARFITPEDIDTPWGEHLWGGWESIIIDADSFLKTVEAGRTVFELTGKEEPGLAYFTVSADSIEWVSFEVEGQSSFSSEWLILEGFTQNDALNDLGEVFFDDLWNNQLRFRYLFLQDLQLSEEFQALSQTEKNTLVAFFRLNNTQTITWVWSNAWMIETYYFWKADKIQDNFYNSIYTTLLWADYGNITTEDYLAGWILFDPENRGLAVTTLLDNPYKTQWVFRIWKESSLRKVASNEDLAQDIGPSIVLTDSQTKVTLNNDALNINIWDVYYNFDSDQTELIACELWVDIDDCSDIEGKTEIILQETSLLYNVVSRPDETVILNAEWEEIFSIDGDWLIQTDIGVQIDVDFDSREKFLKLNLSTVNGEAWVLYFNFNASSTIHVVKDIWELEAINAIQNNIVFHLKTNHYDAHINTDTWIQVSYRDIFDSTKDLENFVEDTPFGFERYETEAWIGFTWTNKSLLSFAAGKTVWEATKDYHSFYMINLWDPVVSLKKIAKNIPFTEEPRNFDSTLGEIISREEGIIDYSFADYNNDGREDIFIHKNSWYIKLLENTSWATKFMDRWNLLYIADISNSSFVSAWDFNGDGYGDIFMVDTTGKPAIFMNDEKKYTRYDLEDQFALNGKITQAEVFDMDANGAHDVVTLDDSWQINIFYWGWTSTNPTFTKLTVEEGIGATLANDVRSTWAALYFDWLLQSSDIEAPTVWVIEEEKTEEEKAEEELIEAQKSVEYCLTTPECMVQVNLPEWVQPSDQMLIKLCSNTKECIDKIVQDRIASAAFAGVDGDSISTSQVQSAAFIDLPYRQQTQALEEQETLSNEEIAWVVTGNFPVLEGTHPDVQAWLDLSQEQLAAYISESRPEALVYEWQENPTRITTFIRSEYAPSVWLEVVKSYSDNDGWYLQSWDGVEAEIIVRNISTEEITNITFVDSFPEWFILDSTVDIYSSIDGLDMESGIWPFQYMFEGFSIPAWEEASFRFALITPPIRVWYMEVWIFEDEGWGNDGKWDIKIKSRKNVCW
jgi:hypothetical protein